MFDILQQNVLHMPIEHGSRNRFISIFDLTEGKADSLQLIASSPTARSVGIFLPEKFIPLSDPLQTGFFDMILHLFFYVKILLKSYFYAPYCLDTYDQYTAQKCIYLVSLNIWNLVRMCGWTFTDGEVSCRTGFSTFWAWPRQQGNTSVCFRDCLKTTCRPNPRTHTLLGWVTGSHVLYFGDFS